MYHFTTNSIDIPPPTPVPPLIFKQALAPQKICDLIDAKISEIPGVSGVSVPTLKRHAISDINTRHKLQRTDAAIGLLDASVTETQGLLGTTIGVVDDISSGLNVDDIAVNFTKHVAIPEGVILQAGSQTDVENALNDHSHRITVLEISDAVSTINEIGQYAVMACQVLCFPPKPSYTPLDADPDYAIDYKDFLDSLDFSGGIDIGARYDIV